MLFGLVGFIDSGKGTVGNILKEKYDWLQDSFAASLKDCVAILFGWPRHLLEGDTKESREFREQLDPWWTEKFGYTVTPRLMLQKFGTEACRNGLSDTIWINSLERRINSNLPTVITDVRFVNEIEAIRNLNGYIIWVRKEKLPEWYDTALYENTYNLHTMQDIYPDIHRSEWDWIGQNFDYIINNDGTLQDLNNAVDKIIEESYIDEMIRIGAVK